MNEFVKILNFPIRFLKRNYSFMQKGISNKLLIRKLKKDKVIFGDNICGKKFYINNKGKIILGNQIFLNSCPNGSLHFTALSTYLPSSQIIIGNNCKLNGTILHCNENITIGNDCMFGPGTIIVDNDSHRVTRNYDERIKTPKSKPIIIKNNVWVGMNCLILKGVTIGENSIIAAGSLVVKDVPDNCLYAGNPAKFIKHLD